MSGTKEIKDPITQKDKEYMNEKLTTLDTAKTELTDYKGKIMVERRDANFLFLKKEYENNIAAMENAVYTSNNQEAISALEEYQKAYPTEYKKINTKKGARIFSYALALYQALLYIAADDDKKAELGITGPGSCKCGIDGVFGINTLVTSAYVLKTSFPNFHGVLDDESFKWLLKATAQKQTTDTSATNDNILGNTPVATITKPVEEPKVDEKSVDSVVFQLEQEQNTESPEVMGPFPYTPEDEVKDLELDQPPPSREASFETDKTWWAGYEKTLVAVSTDQAQQSLQEITQRLTHLSTTTQDPNLDIDKKKEMITVYNQIEKTLETHIENRDAAEEIKKHYGKLVGGADASIVNKLAPTTIENYIPDGLKQSVLTVDRTGKLQRLAFNTQGVTKIEDKTATPAKVINNSAEILNYLIPRDHYVIFAGETVTITKTKPQSSDQNIVFFTGKE